MNIMKFFKKLLIYILTIIFYSIKYNIIKNKFIMHQERYQCILIKYNQHSIN